MQTKRTDRWSKTLPLIDTSNMALGPDDAMQMEVVPFHEPSGGYDAIITAVDVVSHYQFTLFVIKTDALIYICIYRT